MRFFTKFTKTLVKSVQRYTYFCICASFLRINAFFSLFCAKKVLPLQRNLIWRIMYQSKHRAWLVGLLMLLAMPLMAEDVVYLTTEQFKARIFDYKTEKDWSYKGDKPCVIDFYTTWCGPCKRLAPIMEEMSQKYCGEVVFYKADTERERELAYVFGINSIPQVLYIPVEGKPMLLKGLYPKDEIVRIIDEFLLGKKEAK